MSNNNLARIEKLKQIKTRAAAADKTLKDEDFDGFSNEELQEIFLATLEKKPEQNFFLSVQKTSKTLNQKLK